MLSLLPLLLATEPAPIRLMRVDVLAEDPGTWVHDDAFLLFQEPGPSLLHFAEQIKLVWGFRLEGLTVGTSYLSQSVHFERPVFGFQSLTMGGGLQTNWLLPNGVLVDAAWHRGPVRLAIGLSVLSSATWMNLRWDEWRFLPTLGVGIGRYWP